MVRVEAVVVRERVEAVIDAVEEQARRRPPVESATHNRTGLPLAEVEV